MMSAAESDLEDNVFLGDPIEPQRARWQQEDGAARQRAGSLCLNQHQHDTSDDLSAPPQVGCQSAITQTDLTIM